MKISSLVPVAIAAGLVGAVALPAAATAQNRVVTTTRTVVRDHNTIPRRAWHTRRVCRWGYQHHRRVRVCRTVRYR